MIISVIAVRTPLQRFRDWLFFIAMLPVLLLLGLVDDDELDGTGEEP